MTATASNILRKNKSWGAALARADIPVNTMNNIFCLQSQADNQAAHLKNELEMLGVSPEEAQQLVDGIRQGGATGTALAMALAQMIAGADDRPKTDTVTTELQLRLQTYMDRLAEAMTELSNVLKKVSGTEAAIVSNLK